MKSLTKTKVRADVSTDAKASEGGQRKPSRNRVSQKKAVPSIVNEVIASPGEPLDAETRTVFEPRFAHSFDHVRVHTDARASASAEAVNASAYTVGRDVVFNSGQYAPSTPGGRHLLAHELTHVIQQGRGGPASPSLLPGSSLEREAGSTAASFTHTGGSLAVTGSSAPGLARESQSLTHSVDPSQLSDAELEKEVHLLQEDLSQRRQRSDPDTENLAASLNRLETEAKRRFARAPTVKNPLIPTVQGGTDRERLVNALTMLQSIKQVGSGLYEITINNRVINITQKDVDDANRKIVSSIQEGLRKARSDAAYAEGGYDAQSAIDKDHWIISRIVKTIGNIKDPGPFLRAQVAQSRFLDANAQAALKSNDFVHAASWLADSEAAAQKAKMMYQMYWQDIISVGETTITVLEYTRDASFIALGVLATIASGGAAAGLLSAEAIGGSTATVAAIATWAPFVAKVGEAGVKIAYGEKVDWGQLAVDAVVNIVISKLGGKLGEGIAAKLIGENPAAQSLGKHVVANIVSSVITGKASMIFTMSVNSVYARLKGQDVTWGVFMDQLGAQMLDPKSTFLDIVNGAISGYGHGKGAQARGNAQTQGAKTPAAPAAKTTGATSDKAPIGGAGDSAGATAVKPATATDTSTPAGKPTVPGVKSAPEIPGIPAGKTPAVTAPAGKGTETPAVTPPAAKSTETPAVEPPPAKNTETPAVTPPPAKDTGTPVDTAGKPSAKAVPETPGTPADTAAKPAVKAPPETPAVTPSSGKDHGTPAETPAVKAGPVKDGGPGEAGTAGKTKTGDPEVVAKPATEEPQGSKLDVDAKALQGELKEAIDKLDNAERSTRDARDAVKLAKEKAAASEKMAKEAEAAAIKAKGTDKEAELVKAAEQAKKDAVQAKTESVTAQAELEKSIDAQRVAKQAESDSRQLSDMARTEASMPKRKAMADKISQLEAKRAELDGRMQDKQKRLEKAERKIAEAVKGFAEKRGAERAAAQEKLDALNLEKAKATEALIPLKEERTKLNKEIATAQAELKHEIDTTSTLAPDVKEYLEGASRPAWIKEHVNKVATIDPATKKPIDPVYGKPVDSLSPDHIYPVRKIMQLPGFIELSRVEQVEMLTLKENLMGIDPSVNFGKKDRSWAEYEGLDGRPISPAVRKELMAKELEAKQFIEKAIAERLKKVKLDTEAKKAPGDNPPDNQPPSNQPPGNQPPGNQPGGGDKKE